MSDHQHRFVYLRQEEKNTGYDRNPVYEIRDVYFCEGCLTYKRVHVRTEMPGTDSFKRVVRWSGERPDP